MKKKVFAALTAVSVTAAAAGAVIADAAIAKGDVNESGAVEIADATAVLSYYAENAASLSPVFSTDAAKNSEIFAAADVDESSGIDIRDATLILTYYARTAASIETDWESLISGGESGEVPSLGTPDGTLGEGGDTLTIMSYADYELQDMYGIAAEATGFAEDKIVYKNVGEYANEASVKYAQAIASDEDVDIYLCDTDWAMDYINNNEYSAPLSAVGITEDMYANAYDYTVAMGKDNNGILKGASYKADAGGYCYRTDLAEQYLGITDPADMQVAISDWDGFWETAEKVHTASSGVTAMADSLNGVLRAYLDGTRTLSFAENGALCSANIRTEMEKLVPVFKNAYDAGYISTISPWTVEWYYQGMSAGEYANQTLGYFYSTWNLFEGSQLSQAQGYEGTEGSTYGKYNIVSGPAGWYWGGMVMCVSPNTDNATEAGKFLYAMTVDSDTMKKYSDISGNLVNNKSAMDEVVSSGSGSNPLLGGQDHFPALMESAEKVNADIISEYDSTAMIEILISLRDYCEGNTASQNECINNVLINME